ncbi:MAG: hypothetical protein ACOYBW_06040 [Fluviibacter phosphoraccumulans]
MQNAIVETNSVTTLANVAVESNVVALPSVTKTQGMYDRLVRLNTAASAWEDGAYANANAQLYGLFSEARQIHMELTNAQDPDLGAKKQALKDYMNLKGLSNYWDKPLTQRIIRSVFGDRDRRRISTYHTVLRYIVAQNWSPNEVVAGITAAGGVQEISLGHPAGYVSPKNRAAAANAAVSEKALATVQGDKLAQHIDADKHGEKVAAVLTQNADGTFTVNCIVSSNTAVNATLAAYYSKNKAVLSDAAAAKLESDMAASAEDNLAAAKAA